MSNMKRIPDDKYRVIKISKEALFEFICESMIDGQGDYFDVKANKDGSLPIATHFDINWDTGEVIAIARNVHQQWDEVDPRLLLRNMKDTTSTMFEDNRYVELTLEEIKEIQSRGVSYRGDP